MDHHSLRAVITARAYRRGKKDQIHYSFVLKGRGMNPERQSGHTQNPVFLIHSVSTGLCCLWHASGVRNALSTSVCPISCVAPSCLLGQSSPSTALE